MKARTPTPRGDRPGRWSDAPCLGCRVPLNSPDPEQRLCFDCRLQMAVRLAQRIAPTVDVTPRIGRCPQPVSVIDDSDLVIARWATELGFDEHPAGEVYPQERAMAVIEPYAGNGYAIDPVRLAAAVEREMERLMSKRRR